jgi:phage terminase small subunit
MMAKKLTDKQARFVEEYLVDANATQAAIRAGYSENTARAIGSENLSKPDIADAIAEGRAEMTDRLDVKAEDVRRQLARIGFSDLRDLFTWDEERASYVPSRDLTEDQAAAVAAVETETTHYTREDGTRETKIKLKLKTESKVRALELLGKHMAMFTDKRSDEFGGEPISVTEIVVQHDEDG